MSGPALGHKRVGAEKKEQRQMLRDSDERNAIEGRSGNLKRKFILELIFYKLDGNFKTEAALNILAMNATYQLCLWFMQFCNFFRIKFVFQ